MIVPSFRRTVLGCLWAIAFVLPQRITAQEKQRWLDGLTGVAMGSDAVEAALRCYGEIRRIAIVTPYWPPGDAMVRTYFEECGFEVVRLEGLKAMTKDRILGMKELYEEVMWADPLLMHISGFLN